MPAGKRTRVPSKLHSELSEYASLLRALRTSNTLDLASQLTAHASTAASQRDSDGEDDNVEPIEDDDESERLVLDGVAPFCQSVEHPSLDVSTATQRKPKHAAIAKAGSKPTRDTWTRWPLLAGDVYAPEWSLEDEVSSIAVQVIKARHSQAVERTTLAQLQPGQDFVQDSSSADAEQLSDLEDMADFQLTSHASNALTESTGRYLSQILALLAAYVPPGEKSMQNRVRPLDWESVLNIVATNGLVTSNSFDSIRQRLLATYPQSSNSVNHNYVFSQRVSSEDLSFLAVDGYDPLLPPSSFEGAPRHGHAESPADCFVS
ncbi:hypothetical protein BC835DRAFT_578321 [Cytidiella melzeri]|nr:hypothetical protein BC835DRAFT_578321 [Cytidiella melzeri]